MNPSNPSSSQSNVVNISLMWKNRINSFWAYVPGETEGNVLLSEYNVVHIIPNGNSDLSNVNFQVVSGNLDCIPVHGRKTERSLYGINKFVYMPNKLLFCNCLVCSSL